MIIVIIGLLNKKRLTSEKAEFYHLKYSFILGVYVLADVLTL